MLSISTVGCFGQFEVTRKLYGWNERVSGDKWLRSLVFLSLVIVPIYPLSNLFDALFANVVEFWSGHNPMAFVPGTERWAYGLGGEAVRMTFRGDGTVDVLVTNPGQPEKRFSLLRRGDEVALVDAKGVEIARAGDSRVDAPALPEIGMR
jgi:hypothetical protein